MNVLLLNQSFYPDVASTAQHAGDFAAALAADGHAVTVLAARRAYENPCLAFPPREMWRGCVVRRLWSAGLGRGAPWRRLADAATLLAAFCWTLLRLPRFDVVIAMTHPPMIAFLAALAVRLKGGRLISWVMDLNPDEAIAAGWLRGDSAGARLLSGALAFSLRTSTRVVVLDRFMRERIERKGVPSAAIDVIPPWSHDHSVRYDSAGRAAFRASHGLNGKFVVMYAGNLSIVHPIATVLEAARRLRQCGDIAFCFVGGGLGRAEVEAFAAAHGLANIRLLPYQPLETLSSCLSAADLHLVVMGDAMPGIVHPCKIYNILAIGAPFLYIGPDGSHIGDLCGSLPRGAAFSAAHGDVSAVVDAVSAVRLTQRRHIPELLDAARPFSYDVLAGQFTAVVSQASAGRRAGPARGGAGVRTVEPQGGGE